MCNDDNDFFYDTMIKKIMNTLIKRKNMVLILITNKIYNA